MICDTDVMIDYWDVKQSRHLDAKKTLENEIELDQIILSAITKMELMMGAVNKTELASINKKLERFNISLLNNDITLEAFKLIEKYKLSHGLSLPDALIASTALITELELFTYNLKDYKYISGIKLYKP